MIQLQTHSTVRHRRVRLGFCLLVALLFSVTPLPASADNIVGSLLQGFIAKKSGSFGKRTKVGIAVIDAATGEQLFAYHGSEQLVPASVQKVITTVAALKILGAQYKFPTEVFADRTPQEGANVGTLYVRGYGDPTMDDAALHKMARALYRQGVREVNNLVMDDTLFVDPPGPTGPRPYQAGLSATPLNDNCFVLDIAPNRIGERAHVYLSDGTATELVNEVSTVRGAGNKIYLTHTETVPQDKTPRADGFTSLEHEVKVTVRGTIGVDSAPLTYHQTTSHSAAYFGRVFRAVLLHEGIKVSGELLRGETPSPAKRLRVFDSKELSFIIRDLNLYSNNFIAGQILFALGQDSVGLFRHDVGVQRITSFLHEIGVPPESFAVFDGSGLDKRNRVTPLAIVHVLGYAYRDFSILPDMIASLSRFGHSGTLRRRHLIRGKKPPAGDEELVMRMHGVWGKTGTLDAVSSLAGYSESKDRRRLAFAVMVNGQSKGFAKTIENEVVKMLIGLRH